MHYIIQMKLKSWHSVHHIKAGRSSFCLVDCPFTVKGRLIQTSPNIRNWHQARIRFLMIVPPPGSANSVPRSTINDEYRFDILKGTSTYPVLGSLINLVVHRSGCLHIFIVLDRCPLGCFRCPINSSLLTIKWVFHVFNTLFHST